MERRSTGFVVFVGHGRAGRGRQLTDQPYQPYGPRTGRPRTAAMAEWTDVGRLMDDVRMAASRRQRRCRAAALSAESRWNFGRHDCRT